MFDDRCCLDGTVPTVLFLGDNGTDALAIDRHDVYPSQQLRLPHRRLRQTGCSRHHGKKIEVIYEGPAVRIPLLA